VPLQAGSLEVVGVEYSLKAQFPQSETTDYTIHGRQYLGVKGPRLSSTKDHKTKVMYGPDHRLSFLVLDDRPRLVVEFKSAPECLLAGEVRKLDLVMTNTSKTGGYISNISMVHWHPGMFSFTGKNNVRSVHPPPRRQDLPFAFPVVTDPCLNHTGEDGSSVENSLDILPSVVCPDIPAGKSVKVPLWVSGCHVAPAKTFFDAFFYYEYNSDPGAATTGGGSKRPNYRITRSGLSCQVFPSITVTASKMPSCVFNNNPTSALVVNVSNGSTDASKTGGTNSSSSSLVEAARVKGRQLAEIHVSQIALLSGRQFRLESVLSTDGHQPVVNRQESANFCLSLSSANPSSEKDLITVSDVRWKGGGSSTTDELYMDFLKSGFVFEGKSKKPGLAQDLVVVSWLGRLAQAVGGDSSIQGQSYIFLGDGAAAPPSGDVVDSRVMPEVTTDSSSESFPLKVTAEMDQSKLSHDFGCQPLATVPLRVVVENCTDAPACFAYKLLNEGGGGACAFAGCTQAQLTVQGRQTKRLKFQIQVSAPGIYSFQRAFRFRADPNPCDISSTQTSNQELIPLHISFLVEDVRQQK